MRFVLTVAMSCAAAHACAVVEGAKITARDLAAAAPIFASLDPAMVIAPAPIPGVRRVMNSEELARIARANGIAAGSLAELCFERPTTTLTADELLPLLQGAVGIEGARVEILDFTRTAVPRGTLEFSRAGLDGNGLWRGRVKYDDNRTASIWVKVRVTTEQNWIEAIQPLAPGKPIGAEQLGIRSGSRSPYGPAPIGAVEIAAGRTPNRSIRAGEAIFPSMLSIPHDVERGQTVHVEAASGDAKISFDAVAQSSGRAGESVLVRNPENGRYFQARVEAKGKVSVAK